MLAGWVGANSAGAGWFGPLVSHGPRSTPAVALTFDDGPNVPYTDQVRGILDAHGVKGTFFVVGQAVLARPDVGRRLVEDGHLVANHSYTHDYLHWLDPRYRELGQTQAAVDRASACARPSSGLRTASTPPSWPGRSTAAT